MIRINSVSKSYGSFKVLKNCSAHVARGEVVVICGPSGSGKSTLVKTINGLEKIDTGSINVAGFQIEPDTIKLSELRKRTGMVFQHFELFPHLTVLGNVVIAQTRVLGRTRDVAREKALMLLQRVGMEAHKARYPAQISGGQQQRVAIARALALDPEVMLFDEPTSALDPEMVKEVLDVMTELARQGMTMICVTHEMGFARHVANRVYFMDAGEIIEGAPSQEFFDNPETARARSFLRKLITH